MHSVQKKIPKWAKILPEIKQLQRVQKKLNAHLQDVIPTNIDPVRESGAFDYQSYFEHILSKFGLLVIINDPSNTHPVKVAMTFDGGSISRFLGHVTGGSSWWIKGVSILRLANCSLGKVELIKCNPICTAFLLR